MEKVHAPAEPQRCRLVLIVPARIGIAVEAETAFAAGDVASAFLFGSDLDPQAYQQLAQELVEAGHRHGVAVLVADDSRIMGRAEADGLIVTLGRAALEDAVARFSPKRMIGSAGLRSRHDCMEAAEAGADFLFAGKPDGDVRPGPHPKNLEVGEWCAEVMQVPVVVMGGSSVESVAAIARTGADFAALGVAVFGHINGAAAAVRLANELLAANSPERDRAG